MCTYTRPRPHDHIHENRRKGWGGGGLMFVISGRERVLLPPWKHPSHGGRSSLGSPVLQKEWLLFWTSFWSSNETWFALKSFLPRWFCWAVAPNFCFCSQSCSWRAHQSERSQDRKTSNTGQIEALPRFKVTSSAGSKFLDQAFFFSSSAPLSPATQHAGIDLITVVPRSGPLQCGARPPDHIGWLEGFRMCARVRENRIALSGGVGQGGRTWTTTTQL